MSQFKPLPPIQELQQAFDYDPVTGIFRAKYARSNKRKGDILGSPNNEGYKSMKFHGRLLKCSRVAWFLMTGNDPMERCVDNIDRNPFNNAFSNLRLATNAQNQGNKSGRGWSKKGSRYQARIRLDGTNVWLGCYETPEEAQEVYIAKHIEIHGEFSPYCATLTESTT